MQVQELVQALDLVGQVYRSSDGRQPADAIAELKAQLAGFENLTVAEWASLRSKEATRVIDAPSILKSQELDVILEDLENTADDRSTEPAFQKLNSLTLSADGWKKLAKLATGRRASSGKTAKDALRSHLANLVQLHNRRESITRLFP
jgi:hypothetical protein